jgi:transketolase
MPADEKRDSVGNTPDQVWEEEVRRVARGIRKRVLALTLSRPEGCYLSQALSSAEIFATLYTRVLHIGPSVAPRVPPPFAGVPAPGFHVTGADYNGPRDPAYDRFLISAAHYAVAVYAALVETGRMDAEGLLQFNVDGSSVEMIGAEHSPGMEITTGSFGQAMSQAGGVALARRIKGEGSGRVVLFMSDGEFEEGQTYEAVQALAHHKIDNLIVYVDVNGQQVDGLIEEVMNIEPLSERLCSFGAKAVTVNGHDVRALAGAAAAEHPDKPLFVLAYTDPGRGVPLLDERKPNLHFVRFKSEEEREKYRDFLKTM